MKCFHYGARSPAERRESDRLRDAFHRWCGNRTSKEALKAAGIQERHGAAWLRGATILRDDYQTRLRLLFDKSGADPSPAS